jgi:hypothetical protein
MGYCPDLLNVYFTRQHNYYIISCVNGKQENNEKYAVLIISINFVSFKKDLDGSRTRVRKPEHLWDGFGSLIFLYNFLMQFLKLLLLFCLFFRENLDILPNLWWSIERLFNNINYDTLIDEHAPIIYLWHFWPFPYYAK